MIAASRSALPAQLARTLCEIWPDGATPRVRALVERVVEAASVGHTWIGIDAEGAEAKALRAWSGVGGPGADLRPLVIDGERVALRRWWRLEQRVATALRRLTRVVGSTPCDTTSGLEHITDPAQRLAVAYATRAPLSVILGGPGSGKTWTVAQVLGRWIEVLGLAPPRIALAAPTGKAAARLGEAVAQFAGQTAVGVPRARTLHDLLGASRHGARWRHDARAPLIADALVVDEVSMIDLDLMTRLLEALTPGTRLMLLGDPDQLAAVEAGAVLADLRALLADGDLDALLPGAAVVQLTRSHRYPADGGLARIVAAVRDGDVDAALSVAAAGLPELTWVDTDAVDRRAWRRDLAMRLLAAWPCREARPRCIALAAAYDGVLGVDAINAEVRRCAGVGPAAYLDGQPVLITVNDAACGLANGDLGRIERDGEGWAARFGTEGQPRVLPSGRLPAHRDAWAMTVHKAQGSEFDEVIVVLPEPQHPLASRAWLYTAISRARSALTIVGNANALRDAVAHAALRRTGLAQHLAALRDAPR